MLVLERYFKLLEESGEDLSEIYTHVRDSIDEVAYDLEISERGDGENFVLPYASHHMGHSFDGGGKTGLLFQENLKLNINSEELKGKSAGKRSLLDHTSLTSCYSFELDFYYEKHGRLMDHTIVFDSDFSGKIIPNAVGKSSFYLNLDHIL